ncbi:GNAT family N-acetyltransferase [Konateibacter massiliensis]|uniref:GNAT family N-acetyltransferase n=1 Tax=Konateibacter massiliensis TaxID=2002841 RepID=UPI000C15730C|nr:GNAT family N-acetyltransferase [Konateibacter massiliensis]
MYQLAKESDVAELLSYFEQDLKNCLYSYIDLKKYGVEHKDLQIYFQREKDGLTSVATKYYNGLQLYCLEQDFPVEETVSLIQELAPSIISSTPDVIRLLSPHFCPGYELEKGFVTSISKILYTDLSFHVKPADFEDLEEIANLICMDEGLGGHYTVADLTMQLSSRMKENFGRNYIIRQEGNIVCHAATYAEVDNLAVISGVITHPVHRGKGFALTLVSKLCEDLLSEGKQPHLFYYTESAGYLYNKIGFRSPSGWAKLVKHETV